MQIATTLDKLAPEIAMAEAPNLTLAPHPGAVSAAAAMPNAMSDPLPAERLATWLRSVLPSLLMTTLSIGMFIALWYFATKYRWDIYIRFANIPSPGDVLTNITSLLHSDKFYHHMGMSLRRILLGFTIAAGFGITFGLLIGQYRVARGLMLPVFEVLRPIPAIAWVPMAVMLWPTNETSIVFITFLGSFFPILLNTIHGVKSVDPVLLRDGRCLGANEFALLRQVVFPAALPHIFTGLTIGMGVAWVSLIAAEMISGQFGIGYFTWEAYSLIQYADIAIGMIVIGLLGLACSSGIRLLGNMMMPWISTHTSKGRT